jgi:hypothetical protein
MFKIGDIVKVKAGRADGNNPSYDMSGFQGTLIKIITDHTPTIYEVEWDSVTLNQLSDAFLKDAYDRGEDVYHYGWYEEDLEPASPRAQVPVQIREFWDDETDRIIEIIEDETLEVNAETLTLYLEFLNENLTKPCGLKALDMFGWEERFIMQGEGNSPEYNALRKNQPSSKDTFFLIKLSLFSEETDLMAQVRRKKDNKIFSILLSLLESSNESEDCPNGLYLSDFSSWIVNYGE